MGRGLQKNVFLLSADLWGGREGELSTKMAVAAINSIRSLKVELSM